MKRELLLKYLEDNCTEAELSEVLSWINSDEFKEEGRDLILDDWNLYREPLSLKDDETFASIFDKIQAKIDNPSQGNGDKVPVRSLMSVVTSWITKVAAILLLPVLIILGYTLSNRKTGEMLSTNLVPDSLEVIAPMGSRTVVHLSDGSEVHLNYGSKIKYPHYFVGESRDVTLSGEGFFKIAHNPEKPFIVNVRNLKIKAVGTTFNVLAYPDGNVIETTLVNGKVIIDKVEKNGSLKTIDTMEPGQHTNYSVQNDAITSTMGDTEKYISWTSGKLIFDDASIMQVTDRLSRIFNIDFEVKKEVREYIYTVTFTDEHLFQILDLMTIATPVIYKTLPREKLPDGTFKKQKIVIQKRH